MRTGSEATCGCRRASREWEVVPYESRGARETRGCGLDDLAESLQAGRPHRASGALGLHVLETASAVLRAAEEGRTVEIGSRVAGDSPQLQR